MKIQILVTEDTVREFRHVVMKADGGESEEQQIVPIVELLTTALKEGKTATIRHAPRLDRDAEFDTGTVHWTAGSRFTVSLEDTVA